MSCLIISRAVRDDNEVKLRLNTDKFFNINRAIEISVDDYPTDIFCDRNLANFARQNIKLPSEHLMQGILSTVLLIDC